MGEGRGGWDERLKSLLRLGLASLKVRSQIPNRMVLGDGESRLPNSLSLNYDQKNGL